MRTLAARVDNMEVHKLAKFTDFNVRPERIVGRMEGENGRPFERLFVEDPSMYAKIEHSSFSFEKIKTL